MNCTDNFIPSVITYVKTYTSLHSLAFFYSILIAILSAYTDDIFQNLLSKCHRNILTEKIF
jgi:energy-converting hydrogenase Eha subunit A